MIQGINLQEVAQQLPVKIINNLMVKESAHHTNQKGFTPLVVLLLIVAVLGVGYAGYKSLSTSSQPPNQKIIATPQPKNSTTPIPRSKAPGIVTQVSLSTTLDPKTGLTVNPASVFSKTDPTIYAVVTLSNPPVGTKIEYVRYLNGKLLDNRSTSTTKVTAKSIVFDWKLKKPGATHLVGNYRVKIYTNGVFEKETSYIIQ